MLGNKQVTAVSVINDNMKNDTVKSELNREKSHKIKLEIDLLVEEFNSLNDLVEITAISYTSRPVQQTPKP